MNRFILRIVMAFVLSTFSILCFASLGTLGLNVLKEKQAVVQWVQDNAQVQLPERKASAIVRAVYQYSFKRGLDPLLVLSVIRTESGFVETARSRTGAKGLMQVVPYWHRDKLKGRDPFDRNVSIEVGSQILKDCLDKHANNTFRALSCYSGGGGKKYHGVVIANRVSIQRSVLQAQLRNPTQHAQLSYTASLVITLAPHTPPCDRLIAVSHSLTFPSARALNDSFALTTAPLNLDTSALSARACRWDEPSTPSA